MEPPEEIEDEIELEELFFPPPIPEATLPVPDQFVNNPIHLLKTRNKILRQPKICPFLRQSRK
jgi:hypothetical protein